MEGKYLEKRLAALHTSARITAIEKIIISGFHNLVYATKLNTH
jgi:hypothetical protein